MLKAAKEIFMKNKSKKQFTPKERYDYHSSRYMSCGKYGLKFGSPKHCYSFGFTDAFFW